MTFISLFKSAIKTILYFSGRPYSFDSQFIGQTRVCLPHFVLWHGWLTHCLYLILSFWFHWPVPNTITFLDYSNFTSHCIYWFRDDSVLYLWIIKLALILFSGFLDLYSLIYLISWIPSICRMKHCFCFPDQSFTILCLNCCVTNYPKFRQLVTAIPFVITLSLILKNMGGLHSTLCCRTDKTNQSLCWTFLWGFGGWIYFWIISVAEIIHFLDVTGLRSPFLAQCLIW